MLFVVVEVEEEEEGLSVGEEEDDGIVLGLCRVLRGTW